MESCPYSFWTAPHSFCCGSPCLIYSRFSSVCLATRSSPDPDLSLSPPRLLFWAARVDSCSDIFVPFSPWLPPDPRRSSGTWDRFCSRFVPCPRTLLHLRSSYRSLDPLYLDWRFGMILPLDCRLLSCDLFRHHDRRIHRHRCYCSCTPWNNNFNIQP